VDTVWRGRPAALQKALGYWIAQSLTTTFSTHVEFWEGGSGS